MVVALSYAVWGDEPVDSRPQVANVHLQVECIVLAMASQVHPCLSLPLGYCARYSFHGGCQLSALPLCSLDSWSLPSV